MRRFFASDLGFYYGVGVFVIAVFVAGITAIALANPAGIDQRTLVPLTVGFFLFMVVYFVSISVQRLEGGDDVGRGRP